MPRSRKRSPAALPGQARSVGSLRRTPGARQSRKVILIVCEGLKTEPIYFTDLRNEYKLSTVDVLVVGAGASPITVVEQAIGLRDERMREARRAQRRGEMAELPFDEVWCVFDVEVLHNNPSFAPAVSLADDEGIALAITNPAFEFWFLLHFTFTTRSFHHADELIAALKVYIPAYTKGMDCSPLLANRMETASVHAARILDAAAGDRFPHPSTTVHKLVSTMREMGLR
jgi:hypothetical protein